VTVWLAHTAGKPTTGRLDAIPSEILVWKSFMNS